jgi:lipopolysaccharide export LptBFGC system permease protein LptF
MASELDFIADPAERRRFAVGAVAAVFRLALSACGERTVHALRRFVGIPESADNANPGAPSMPEIPTRRLLRRHVRPFAVTFVASTALSLTNFAASVEPQLSARGASAGTYGEALLLALPATIALTIPMAVLLAVLWVFTRLGREGVLTAARRERHGVRRLLGPVLGAAALVAVLTLVSNTRLLPPANAGLREVLLARPTAQTERDMTVGELREAARTALTEVGPGAAARAAMYQVEIQKKFALAAACLFLALAGAAIPLRFPRGGNGLVIGASVVVLTGYYLSLLAGETLADERVISPSAAMWMGNALLLAAALLLLSWRPGDPSARRTFATGGDGGDAGMRDPVLRIGTPSATPLTSPTPA